VEEGIEERPPESAPLRHAAEDAGKRLRFVRWSYTWVWVVVIVGVLVTAGLALVSAELAASNERHLLKLRSKEVASVFTSALPDIETPLGAAVALANITGADPAKFTQFASAYVGQPSSQFTSMSIWQVGHFNQGPLVVVGTEPELSQARGGIGPILRAATKRTGSRTELTVRGLLHATQPRLAYAYAGTRPGTFIVEAESALPKTRYTRVPANSAYSNIDAAVYVGMRPVRQRLLLSTVRHLPLPGQHSVTVLPFGSDFLTVVISARQPLGGSLPQQMPWVIAILGALLTAGAGVLTFRLIWGGRRVQGLAAENRRLYSEQHEIASSLQQALLPDELPQIAGLRLAGLYDAGMPGIDIGGDWYDIIRIGPDRLLLVVGDVSGRGIRAAAAMASVRSAIQYAAQIDDPEVFLPKLSGLRSLREHGMLATVLCVVIDLREQRVRVTSAGHLPPLLVDGGRSQFLESEVGLPIGVDTDATYRSSSFPVPNGAYLFGFTDGLIERHDESLDQGLERLRSAATEVSGDLEEMMAAILERVRAPQSVDDTAMTGVQWVTSNPN
jgi:Stage II sporulation protein E (SpoIIE)